MSVKKYNIPPDAVDFLLHCKCRHNVFLVTYTPNSIKVCITYGEDTIACFGVFVSKSIARYPAFKVETTMTI